MRKIPEQEFSIPANHIWGNADVTTIVVVKWDNDTVDECLHDTLRIQCGDDSIMVHGKEQCDQLIEALQIASKRTWG